MSGIANKVGMGRHFAVHEDVAVGATAAASTEIDFARYAGGAVIVPAGSSLTTLTYWAAEQLGGTYLAAYDEDGDAITQTVAASRVYELPKSLYGVGAIKIVGNVAGVVDCFVKG